MKIRIIAIILILVGVFIGYFNYNSEIDLESKFPFKLGLDLAGGTHLVYSADISNLKKSEVKSSMDALRDVIERRTNLFGVSEPLVQIERTKDDNRLIVELPGVTDINQAVTLIGQTPLLEFKKERDEGKTQLIIEAQQKVFKALENGEKIDEQTKELAKNVPFENTGLTGRYL